MNSVIQCLIWTKPFLNAIQNYKGKNEVANALKKTMAAYFRSGSSPSNIREFHSVLAADDYMFAVGRMSDSFFALSKILSLLKDQGLAQCFSSSLVNRCKLWYHM